MKSIFITTSKIGAENQGDYIYSSQIFNVLNKSELVDLFSFEQKNNYLAVLLFFFLPMMWVRNFSLTLCMKLLKERDDYDVIYLDHYRCAWVSILAKLLNKKIFVFNHNLESSVYRSLSKSSEASIFKRVFCFFEYTKVYLTELVVFRIISGLSSISGDDIPEWARVKLLVLPPYSSEPFKFVGSPNKPTAIIVGSFHWRLKQHNLQVFLDAFYEVYKQNPKDCSVIVAGSAPSSFYNSIRNEYPFVTVIDGFNDLSELAGIATIGVCPDHAGGGFKLKTLDYFKLNLPMIAIENGASGVLEPVVPSFNTFQCLAKEVYSLLGDEKQRHSLFQKQNSYFLRHHSEDAFLGKIRVFSER
ncbi:glycosyltransferase [Photobacterium chitinilyticum]|uniref:Glycosyltransferase n=1 Tax=Photobacterium chitinilyticum TaxID=2485123 RepID=A0A444JTY8_9GAMM|nr:glycosyltransferase [Photobacterium chitinilyticum]RWX56592.1 glycosyltransferase [Photobacterium chitinilyticum]